MMRSEPAFADMYAVHQAVEVLVSAALKDQRPIWTSHAVTSLEAAFPNCGLSRDELRDTIMDAALKAGAPVRTPSAANFFRGPAQDQTIAGYPDLLQPVAHDPNPTGPRFIGGLA
jgi:hypothetical protein